MRKVAVIGGGAAGMMAAIAAAEAGAQVTLFEQNEKLGKKLFITGKGRCNITNACDTLDFFDQVPRNKKFLYSAVYRYDAQAVMDFLAGEGLALKVERGNRVFPASDRSSDVIRTVERALRRRGVIVRLDARVTGLLTDSATAGSEDDFFALPALSGLDESSSLSGKKSKSHICGIVYRKSFLLNTKNTTDISRNNSTDRHAYDEKNPPGKDEIFFCDAVIMATGGLSYPSTGSDGSGFALAKQLGHSVTDLRPALVGFTTKEAYIPQLMGLSLRNIKLHIFTGEKKLFSDFGELLFTHRGISGPLVLTASSLIADRYFTEAISFVIDLKPALSEEQLGARILRDFEEQKNKQFKNALHRLLPAKLIPVIVSLSGIDPEKQINRVTGKERQRLVFLLKHFPGTITGLCGFSEAIITRGGISVKEVDPSTMESKLVAGLFLCGEMLDVDALTGGYNLQIAWSTGHLAGESSVG